MSVSDLEADAPSGGCILKLRLRRSFSQLAEYCGSHATDFDGTSMTAAIFTNMASREPRDLSKEIGFCFRQRSRKIKNTGHLIISPSTPFKTKEDLQTAINISVEAHGLQEIPWAAWYHGEPKEKHPHLHLAFSLVGWDGRSVGMSHSYRKNDDAAKKIMDSFPYLGKLKLRNKAQRPWNAEKGHAAFRREDRKTKELNNETGAGQMTTENKIKELENQVRAGLARAVDLDTFRDAVQEETGAKVEFWRDSAGNTAGWSLILPGPGGTKLKGSEISRSLSLKKVIEALEDAARRRRMAGRQVEATVEAIAGTGEVLAAAGQTVHAAASNVVSLGLGTQPRAIVQPTRPAPSAKPYSIQPQGLQIPGYVVTRGTCLDPDRGIHMWTYVRAGSEGETVFSDDGESLQLHGEALGDPLAIDAFVQSARARFGSSLTLTVSQIQSAHPNFLAMLAASANERGVEIIDARTGLPIPATQQHKEPAPAPEAEQQGLDFLRSGSDPAASAAPVAAGAGQGVAPAVLASGEQRQKDSLVVPAHDLAGRRAAAQKVLAMASEQAKTASGGAPGHRLGVLPRGRVSAQELRALLAEAESWLPVQEWAAVTGDRQCQDRGGLEGDGRDPKHLILSRAALRHDPLALAANETLERFLYLEACAVVARRARDERSGLQKGVELVTGKHKEREDEIARLEGSEREARVEAARARAAFFGQENNKKAVAETAELAATHAVESHALRAVELLLGLLAKFVKALAGMLAQAEAREAEQDRERERREDRQRHAEALAAGDPVAIKRHEREREQKEIQEQQAREQFSFERGRG